MNPRILIVVVGLGVLSMGCLRIPEGTHMYISSNGSTSAGDTPYGEEHPANFYWAPLREVVLVPGQGPRTILHEFCHAHQHQTILGELGIEPENPDLRAWHRTAEGHSFSLMASMNPRPWSWLSSSNIDIEDFANTCALWLDAPQELKERSPVRYQWVQEWLS